jgi:hypothetical protein
LKIMDCPGMKRNHGILIINVCEIQLGAKKPLH